MNNFPDQLFETMGGNRSSFTFAPVTDVSTMPYINKGIAAELPTLHGGASWYNGISIMDEFSFDEPSKISEPGASYEPKVSGRVIFSADFVKLFAEMTRNRFVVIVTDNDGVQSIHGSIKNGLRFRYQVNKGRKPSDPKVIDFEFSTTSAHPSVVIDA